MGIQLVSLALVAIASVAPAQDVDLRAAASAPSASAPSQSATTAADTDIVVTARRRSCDVSIADRLVSTREFNERAAEWAAGRLVRVHVPRQSDMRCLTKIAFRLADRGVQRMVFIEPGH